MEPLKRLVLTLLLLSMLVSSVWAQTFVGTLTLQSAASTGNGTTINVAGLSLVAVQIIGTAGADRVITFNASLDASHFQAISCRNMNTGANATTATASGTTVILYACAIGGMQQFQAPVSAGTTGTVTVTATALPNVSTNQSGTGSGVNAVANPTGTISSNSANNGTAVTAMRSDGTPAVSTTASFQLGQVALGAALTLTTGALGLAKITASASAPGAAGAKFEVVCGTNAGTAKLIMYAGTSTTAVTVIDNVGSGVTGC